MLRVFFATNWSMRAIQVVLYEPCGKTRAFAHGCICFQLENPKSMYWMESTLIMINMWKVSSYTFSHMLYYTISIYMAFNCHVFIQLLTHAVYSHFLKTKATTFTQNSLQNKKPRYQVNVVCMYYSINSKNQFTSSFYYQEISYSFVHSFTYIN